MNTKTKFNHRDISVEDGVMPVDLYSAVAAPTNAILTFAQLLDDNIPDLTNDPINETLLRQLKLNAMDVLSISQGFANSFDFVGKIDESAPENTASKVASITEASTKGEMMANDMLFELRNTSDPEGIEDISLSFTEYFAYFAKENTTINTHALLHNFLAKVITVIPQEEVEEA